ncbi:MAG: hypothetical protein OEZ01_02395 [Candidatus Heimdallarchaeota archaeon]|nr:hypothetical protein [Candidatus Heimdallarchaeota archaeon]
MDDFSNCYENEETIDYELLDYILDSMIYHVELPQGIKQPSIEVNQRYLRRSNPNLLSLIHTMSQLTFNDGQPQSFHLRPSFCISCLKTHCSHSNQTHNCSHQSEHVQSCVSCVLATLDEHYNNQPNKFILLDSYDLAKYAQFKHNMDLILGNSN